MPARTPGAAVREHVSRLQSIASCVCEAVALQTSSATPPEPWAVSLSPQPVQLGALSMTVRQQLIPIRTERGWDTAVSGYWYSVYADAEGGSELFAYHWHPVGRSHMRQPHLHPGAAMRAAIGRERQLHLPTVAVQDFVAMLITEFEVPPRRRDWRARLGQVQ